MHWVRRVIDRGSDHRRLPFLAIAVAVLVALPVAALGHQPNEDQRLWTCVGGQPNQNGNCWLHHHSLPVTWRNTLPVAWNPAARAGAAVWDRTDGHQFDFQENANSANIVKAAATSSCVAGWIGCTTWWGNAAHITQFQIVFKSGVAWDLNPGVPPGAGLISLHGVAAHEFGHALGLGDAADVPPFKRQTMDGANSFDAQSLEFFDKKGRCQIYGHTHGWWGGCANFGGVEPF
jgi:hypothetical protein